MINKNIPERSVDAIDAVEQINGETYIVIPSRKHFAHITYTKFNSVLCDDDVFFSLCASAIDCWALFYAITKNLHRFFFILIFFSHPVCFCFPIESLFFISFVCPNCKLSRFSAIRGFWIFLLFIYIVFAVAVVAIRLRSGSMLVRTLSFISFLSFSVLVLPPVGHLIKNCRHRIDHSDFSYILLIFIGTFA